MNPEGRRLRLGLLLAALVHALLLSLTLGGSGFGPPRLGVPWQDQRTEVPDLRLVLVPSPKPDAEPLQSTGTETVGQAASVVASMLALVSPVPPPSPLQPLPRPQLTVPASMPQTNRVEGTVPLPAGQPSKALSRQRQRQMKT